MFKKSILSAYVSLILQYYPEKLLETGDKVLIDKITENYLQVKGCNFFNTEIEALINVFSKTQDEKSLNIFIQVVILVDMFMTQVLHNFDNFKDVLGSIKFAVNNNPKLKMLLEKSTSLHDNPVHKKLRDELELGSNE